MNEPKRPAPQPEAAEAAKKAPEKKPPLRERALQTLYDVFEVLATVTVTVLCGAPFTLLQPNTPPFWSGSVTLPPLTTTVTGP